MIHSQRMSTSLRKLHTTTGGYRYALHFVCAQSRSEETGAARLRDTRSSLRSSDEGERQVTDIPIAESYSIVMAVPTSAWSTLCDTVTITA